MVTADVKREDADTEFKKSVTFSVDIRTVIASTLNPSGVLAL